MVVDELVSVVTPCYNGENYIGRFLDSILAQTYPDIELVIINDGSTDQTEEVINVYRSKFDNKGISLIYDYQENAGQAAALNRGLKLVSGEYLLCTDSDDVLSDDFIEVRVSYLVQHCDEVYCYGKADFVQESDPTKVISSVGKRDSDGKYDFFESVLYSKGVFFSGYMIKTEAFDQVIKNRDIFDGRGGQNAQILLPLAWYYGEPGYVNKSVYTYYIRNDSHSHSQDTSEKTIQRFYEYEKILISTLERINDKKATEYIDSVRKYYSRLRFGNAVDTRNGKLIRKQLRELVRVGKTNRHDILLAVKYSLPFWNRELKG